MTVTMPAPALQDCGIVLRIKELIDVKVCRTVCLAQRRTSIGVSGCRCGVGMKVTAALAGRLFVSIYRN